MGVVGEMPGRGVSHSSPAHWNQNETMSLSNQEEDKESTIAYMYSNVLDSRTIAWVVKRVKTMALQGEHTRRSALLEEFFPINQRKVF